MTKGLFKDFIREIKVSLNRFISIMCIVAIGTAFFVGLKSSAPDLGYTMDHYYDDYNISDLQAFSIFGFTQNDIDEIKKLKSVDQVQAGYFTDAITYTNGQEQVYRIHSLPKSYLEGNKSVLNQVEVVEGRLPQNAKEIVVERGLNIDYGVNVGDEVTFESGKAEKLTDGVLHTDTFKVVGKVITPFYLTTEKGNSQIDGKTLASYAYISEEAFDYDGVYTEALITIKGARALNAFSSDYDALIKESKIELGNVGVDQSRARFEDIKGQAYDKLNKGEGEFEKQNKKFHSEIGKAEKELEQAHKKLTDGEKELSIEKEKAKLQIEHAYDKIHDGEAQLKRAEEQLAHGKAMVKAAKKVHSNAQQEYNRAMQESQKYLDLLKDLDAQLKDLDQKLVFVQEQLNNLQNDPNASPELKEMYQGLYKSYTELYELTSAQYKQINKLYKNVNGLIDNIDQTLATTGKELADAEQKLAVAQQEYDQAKAQLAQGEAYTSQMEAMLDAQFAGPQSEIDQGWRDYKAGVKKLNKERAEGQKKLDDAKMEIVDARHQIELMENAEWFVLDRNMNYGFASYSNTVDNMEAIAKIMPLFFILVAVLVCMTTMTRMVNEQRGTIGTYKALGYGDYAISSKYVLYVAFASIIGAAVGATLGILLFPKAVYVAWSAMYNQPEFLHTPQPLVVISSLLVSVVAMMATAYYTCHKELITVPAQLMRPKAPKAGKKIFLERIPLIWSHLSFSRKVTARNIFRYKKRLYMTVIGIMGCTALLLTGLGMDDTISTVVSNQFEHVFRYDVSTQIKQGASKESRDEVMNALKNSGKVETSTAITSTSFTLSTEEEEVMTNVYVTSNPKEFQNYIHLAQRESQKPITLKDDGIVLTEKLAEVLHVSTGDYVDLKNKEGITKKMLVTGVTENYVFHYAYMTQECYRSNFWSTLEENNILIKLKDNVTDQQVDGLCDNLEHMEAISSVMSFTDLASDFEKQIVALKSIILIIIVCAALLAFVVLYNLTNVNISERIKEIATIKVLGFKGNEVAMYVYRENLLLTIMGAALGLFLGVGLHRLIMKSIEQSNIMFGYLISPMSFVWAFVLTCVFSIIVMLYMYRKIVNVPMVESLKAVE